MCQLDTGVTCYAISHRNLVQLLQNGDPPIRKSNSQLKLFEGILISPVGEITLTVERKGNRRDLRFQVVNSTNKLLLSVETCEQLELLKVESDPEESINSVRNSLLKRDQIFRDYSDVFEGLGHFGDTKIITDPSVNQCSTLHVDYQSPYAKESGPNLLTWCKKQHLGIKRRFIVKSSDVLQRF